MKSLRLLTIWHVLWLKIGTIEKLETSLKQTLDETFLLAKINKQLMCQPGSSNKKNGNENKPHGIMMGIVGHMTSKYAMESIIRHTRTRKSGTKRSLQETTS